MSNSPELEQGATNMHSPRERLPKDSRSIGNARGQCRGNIIWLTGASSGIGLQLAKDLVAEGNFVILSGRNKAPMEVLRQEFPNCIHIIDFDLSDTNAWQDVTLQLKEVTDSIDILIMAAGVCEYVNDCRPATDLYRRVFEINFFAAVKTVEVALGFLTRAQNRGYIVGVGSLSAQVGFSRAQAYGASKAAFEYWLDCLRIDLHAKNIDVSVVSPGFVDTPLTKKNDFSMPGLMTVEDASERIINGMSHRKMHIRFPKRLFWPLRLASIFSQLWYKRIALKLRRQQSL
ncbi:SDR family NAD(P)-dependent oxidoreductase [Marinibactrum halimedae]|uniref:Short-chain dehydrogenase n=1 Tax=Marinibactrum halimedae TaxID=1444977 RepID=A0AA37WP02_9GAMM|nr:SDR family NAD(P)-dependent oxidoreductase [Marinibactrum halimedae]MCD9457558.1 SDR family NAD(P)-dependent oxidoreductase [Marinibactrum halimedae]GLS27978.1 short-chain dehydrogenase [Marinibactrum halimedae]